MRIVRFDMNGVVRFGRIEAGRIQPVSATTLAHAMTAAPDGDAQPLQSAALRAPVARPGKILGIGVNYAAHAGESRQLRRRARRRFRNGSTSRSPRSMIPAARFICRKCRTSSTMKPSSSSSSAGRAATCRARARTEIIAGVCCGADFSVRDWQKASPTMIMGKGFDTHAPIGPAMVTLDEVGGLEGLKALEIRGLVNGEIRQRARLGDMIHDVAAQIAHLTAAFTLEPGDLLFTGTPAGVGAGRTPPQWLKPGDRFRVEIDAIGAIENEIVTEPGHTVIG